MYRDGFKNITNIDISKVVIKSMQEKYRNYEKTFKCKRNKKVTHDYTLYKNKDLHMDARNMNFEDDTFDCIIDKGTFDALIVRKNIIK